jgi:hypothetical protein
VQSAGVPALRILHSIESRSFRHRYGPIEDCFPGHLPIQEWQIARDAAKAFRGCLAEPIITGDVTVGDTSRGKATLDYEVYSNTYLCFVLLTPHRRLTIGPSVRAVWNS